MERAGHLTSGKGVKGTQKKPGWGGVGWGEVTLMNLTWLCSQEAGAEAGWKSLVCMCL